MIRTGEADSGTDLVVFLPFDLVCGASGSGVLCLAISVVIISWAGSFSLDFTVLLSEGFVMRLLKESFD